jgi:hypothetical protein
MSVTSLARHAQSPAPPDEPGIVITAVQPAPRALHLHGAFRLDMSDIEALGPTPSRSLALLVTHRVDAFIGTPFRDFLVFGDDLLATPGGAVGYFNLDVFELLGGPRAGDHHLSVSLGRHVSNVVSLLLKA